LIFPQVSPAYKLQENPTFNRRYFSGDYPFYIDEVSVKINGKRHGLGRAVDQDGEVVDMYL
jgi:transposase-like protein